MDKTGQHWDKTEHTVKKIRVTLTILVGYLSCTKVVYAYVYTISLSEVLGMLLKKVS